MIRRFTCECCKGKIKERELICPDCIEQIKRVDSLWFNTFNKDNNNEQLGLKHSVQ